MPILSRVVNVDGLRLLDGGIVDSVPYAYMEQLGYTKNLLVLTQPRGYRKKKSSSALCKLFLRKYPLIAEAMANRHVMYNRQMEEIEKREKEGKAFVIRPPKDLGISRTEKDPKELERVYKIGRKETESHLSEIRAFLSL